MRAGVGRRAARSRRTASSRIARFAFVLALIVVGGCTVGSVGLVASGPDGRIGKLLESIYPVWKPMYTVCDSVLVCTEPDSSFLGLGHLTNGVWLPVHEVVVQIDGSHSARRDFDEGLRRFWVLGLGDGWIMGLDEPDRPHVPVTADPAGEAAASSPHPLCRIRYQRPRVSALLKGEEPLPIRTDLAPGEAEIACAWNGQERTLRARIDSYGVRFDPRILGYNRRMAALLMHEAAANGG